MKFTYLSYEKLLNSIIKNNYIFSDYKDNVEKAVILRHDVDYSLEKTIRIAEIEKKNNVNSTFFIMLTCDFYNIFSLSGRNVVDKLLSLGHDIGLHFDEMRYPEIIGKPKEIIDKIVLEASILSKVIGKEVTKVSMHRPSKEIIEANLTIPQIVNTYSYKYFSEYKYISDSRRRWREPILDIINGRQYEKIQILIHPFWYNDEELSLEDTIRMYVNSANRERYRNLIDNFTNLFEVMRDKDVMGV